jgi:glycosyltransferase involved in cell wall biosynthesis
VTRDVEQGLRILMIAAHYPPSSAAAAIRARNLVRNLQSLNHQVRVITARSVQESGLPPEATAVPWLDLERLAKRSLRPPRPEQAHVPARSWQKRLRWFSARVVVPDLHAPWIPMATLAARRLVVASDVIVSTGAASAHVVARIVRGQRPWIVDINDLWWRNPHRPAGVLRERIDWHIESGIITAATALTVPNDALGAEIRRRFGRSPETILTGFDPSEFEPSRHAERTSRREIVFAGTLYRDFRLSLLLDALAKGREEHGWSSETLRVVFIGSGAGEAFAEAAAHGVSDFVDAVSPQPRAELLRALLEADALLMPLYPSDPYHLPMRFFDFVGSGRPMIGVGSAAAPAAEMIGRHAVGIVCSTTGELTQALDELVQNGRPADLPVETRREFELGTSRPQLAKVLERVTGAG